MSEQQSLPLQHPAVWMAEMHRERFTADFMAYLPDNLHVFDAFSREARAIHRRGFRHYSARTIVEVLRHNSALQEAGGQWKLNDHNTPALARLFDLMNPAQAGLFEFRKTPSVERDHGAAYA